MRAYPLSAHVIQPVTMTVRFTQTADAAKSLVARPAKAYVLTILMQSADLGFLVVAAHDGL